MNTRCVSRCSRTLGLGLLVLCILLAPVAQAHPGYAVGSVPAPSASGLAAHLNPDGTLNNLPWSSGGSVDAHGYTLQTGPDGAPRFLPRTGSGPVGNGPANAGAGKPGQGSPVDAPVPGSYLWDTRFSPRGVDAPVHAIAVSGSTVYVGGEFWTAGDAILVGGIARWDGTTWTALGKGIGTAGIGEVLAIVVSGNDVYVGGDFTQAGGQPAANIARWDGSAWQSLGTGAANGVNGSVQALALVGSDVYVGGTFTTAGGQTANHLARWDGSAWHPVGSGTAVGVNGAVQALATNGSTLYVAGAFTQAGGQAANHLARWDGVAWAALGSGVDNTVYALALVGSDLYAGGSFTTAGGQTANRIARWTGTAWTPLITGLYNGTTGPVYALAVSGSTLYLGGAFGAAGGQFMFNLARYNTGANTWASLGSGVAGTGGSIGVLALGLLADGGLAAGGRFDKAGSTGAWNIATWNGSTWAATGTGQGLMGGDGDDTDINALATQITGTTISVFAGGTFRYAGGGAADYVAKWDGTAWSPLGSGLNGPVYALALSGDNLFVGGSFSHAGIQYPTNIARWNISSNTWYTMGSGVSGGNSYVAAIVVNGSNVYVGGDFTSAGGQVAHNIARWNMISNAWYPLGSGTDAPVAALALDATGAVLAGGSFIHAGGQVAEFVARWSAGSWSALSGGATHGMGVNAIAVNGPDIYVGGRFSQIGGLSLANNIAHWDGNHWMPVGGDGLGGPFSPVVYALAVAANGDLYIGGSLTQAGSQPVQNIARWDGNIWSTFRNGVWSTVKALALSGPGMPLYVGGQLVGAGPQATYGFARWYFQPNQP